MHQALYIVRGLVYDTGMTTTTTPAKTATGDNPYQAIARLTKARKLAAAFAEAGVMDVIPDPTDTQREAWGVAAKLRATPSLTTWALARFLLTESV